MPRDYFPGMGQAVADRTINRGDEGWGDVARRVALGNSAVKGGEDQDDLEYHIGRGTILMSGRHLQHGDETQPDRNIEVFANCSTSAQRALGFYLLLNGSGVGSSYDDALMVVDFRNMPEVINVIDEDHADVLNGMITGYPTLADIRKPCTVFRVPDSREGWAQALEEVENAAWAADKAEETLVLDWSGVRPYGSPIGGMQGRPSSGPCAVMESISKVALIKYQKDMPPWRQAMQIDHHMAECVLVGGARRAARIAVKIWSDPGILDFIRSKEDGDLWSANHSIGVDVEFWRQDTAFKREVLAAATHVQYHGGKGEPGFLNLDMLSHGETRPTLGDVEKMAGKYQLTPAGLALRRALARAAGDMKYFNIVNPCGEIRLNATGGYCVEGQTRILHRAGYDRIVDLVGKTVEVFNGEEWSAVEPFQTGSNQTLVRVTMSDGSYLDCTPEHRFSVRGCRQGRKYTEKRAHELTQGDILPTFRTPEDIEGECLEDAYTYGAFLGDGGIERRADTGTNRYELCLYAGKHHLPVSGTRGREQANGGVGVCMSHLDKDLLISLKGDQLPDRLFQLGRESTLQFVLGWLDTDGTAHKDTGGVSITAASEQRAHGLQLLLRRLGVSFASARMVAAAGETTNFGERKLDLWQVYVPEAEAGLLQGHRVGGSSELRLDRTVKQPRVVSVEPLEGLHDTFCFTEPKRGMGVFNNVLTYQCVIADVVPYHAGDDEEAMEAFALATRALLRTNMQTAMYQGEVDRTNRIGVGMTGFHEYAWERFALGWKGMLEVDPSGLMIEDANGAPLEAPSPEALPLWNMVSAFADVVDEACWEWGGVFPASRRTFKPAGTTSKLFGLTEGAHLPPMLEYLRWVQYRSDSPLLPELIAAGYPTRVLETYKGVTIVGFPTQPVICTLGMGDELVTAPNATPAEHFRFLRLLETYWLKVTGGNQISYTLKYDPRAVTYDEYQATIMDNMPKVRAVAVMPFGDTSGYEYLPEEEVSAARFAELVARIEGGRVEEDIGREHVECSTGACPITFN